MKPSRNFLMGLITTILMFSASFAFSKPLVFRQDGSLPVHGKVLNSQPLNARGTNTPLAHHYYHALRSQPLRDTVASFGIERVPNIGRLVTDNNGRGLQSAGTPGFYTARFETLVPAKGKGTAKQRVFSSETINILEPQEIAGPITLRAGQVVGIMLESKNHFLFPKQTIFERIGVTTTKNGKQVVVVKVIDALVPMTHDMTIISTLKVSTRAGLRISTPDSNNIVNIALRDGFRGGFGTEHLQALDFGKGVKTLTINIQPSANRVVQPVQNGAAG